MITDGHMHLENGELSITYVMEYVNAAMKAGIQCIQILDHTHRFQEFAFLYPKLKQADAKQKAWLDKKGKESITKYYELIDAVKQMDLPITVRFGLEVCYDVDCEEELRPLLQAYPYDFMIGSIHSIDGLLYDMNGFSREILWDKYPVNDIYKRYYEIMEKMIKSDLFTQIGHPDQLKLFHYEPTYDLRPTYERIAHLAKEHHVYMEDNTGIHYRYGHDDKGTNDEFMNILKAHDVTIMTASDAHQPKDVGKFILEKGIDVQPI